MAWLSDRAATHAAAIAFYTLFSLAPMAVMMITVAGLVFGERVAQSAMLAEVGRTMGPEAEDVVRLVLKNALAPRQTGWAVLLALGGMFISATATLAQVQDSLNHMWGVRLRADRGWFGWVRGRVASLVTVAGMGLLLLVSLITSQVVDALDTALESFVPPGGEIMWQLLNSGFFLIVVLLFFAMLFKLLPDAIVDSVDVMIGATVATLLFAIGKVGIGSYLNFAKVGSVYGAAGSLAILLVWIYYSALIFLLAGEFVKVYAQFRGRAICPNLHAERVALRVVE